MEWLPVILSFFQPMLLKCFEKTSSEDPQAVLRSNYNAATGKMDPDIVEDSIPSTRRAAHKARKNASKAERKTFPRYSRQELYDITEKNLIDSMNAPPETVAAVRSAAYALPDGDDE